MKQEYTLAELQTEMDALAQLFDSVTLADPRMGLLDPATLQPLNKVAAVPVLDADGRGMRIVKAKNGLEAVIAQGISVAGTPCVVMLAMPLPHRLQADGVNVGLRHCCNSAGTLLHPEYHLDMCRLGLSQYGLDPDPCMKALLDVRPAMSLYTVVSMVKEIPAGATVSYGRQYTAPTPRRIATVAIGYADGYPRSLSNRAEMLLHGKRAPVIGRVCMDQMMVDVTDIPGVKLEDPVVLVGRDGDEVITVEDMAAAADTFNYELVCGLSRRVPRIYTRQGKETYSVHYLLENG